MTSTHPRTVDGLRLRRELQNASGLTWTVPTPYGPDGWEITSERLHVLVSVAPYPDGVEWVHASMTHRDGVPSYEALTWLHRAVYGDGYAYQCFVPEASHVNIHPNALHLWGRADGQPAMPDFGAYVGSI